MKETFTQFISSSTYYRTPWILFDWQLNFFQENHNNQLIVILEGDYEVLGIVRLASHVISIHNVPSFHEAVRHEQSLPTQRHAKADINKESKCRHIAYFWSILFHAQFILLCSSLFHIHLLLLHGAYNNSMRLDSWKQNLHKSRASSHIECVIWIYEFNVTISWAYNGTERSILKDDSVLELPSALLLLEGKCSRSVSIGNSSSLA